MHPLPLACIYTAPHVDEVRQFSRARAKDLRIRRISIVLVGT